MTTSNAATWLDGFLDDASVLPPTTVPLEDAVRGYRAHQQSAFASALGTLIVPDVKLPDLFDVLDAQDSPDSIESALNVTVLVTGGAGAIEPAVRWANRSPLVQMRRLELALRNEEDLAHNARRFVAALDASTEDLADVSTFVVLPDFDAQPPNGWLAALDVLAEAELGVLLRTRLGARAIAQTIEAALDRELPMHGSAVSSPLSNGSDEVGFVNLFRAVRGCLDGDDVETLLREESAQRLLADQDAEALMRTRRWLTGVDVCSILDAHEELADLGLSPRR